MSRLRSFVSIFSSNAERKERKGGGSFAGRGKKKIKKTKRGKRKKIGEKERVGLDRSRSTRDQSGQEGEKGKKEGEEGKERKGRKVDVSSVRKRLIRRDRGSLRCERLLHSNQYDTRTPGFYISV